MSPLNSVIMWDKHKAAFYKRYGRRFSANQDTNYAKKPVIDFLNSRLSLAKSILFVGGGSMTGNSIDDQLARILSSHATISTLDPHCAPVNYTVYRVTHINRSIAEPPEAHHPQYDAVLCLSSILMDLYPHALLDAISNLKAYTNPDGIIAIDINTRYNSTHEKVFYREWKYFEEKPYGSWFLNLSPTQLKGDFENVGLAYEADLYYTSLDLAQENQNNPRYLGIWKKN